VAALLEPLGREVANGLERFDLTGALERIWEVVRALNRHVEATAPWQLAKDDGSAEELDRVLYDLIDGLRAVAVALAAYLPSTSARILVALGQPASVAWDEVAYGRTKAVEGLEPAAPLFPRVDEPTLAA
jgi:methionyl-tRNA synthetase